MTVCYLEQRDWKLRRVDAQAASLLMVVEGLMVWMAYLSLTYGKPLLFARSRTSGAARWRRPTIGIWRGFLSAGQGLRQILSRQTKHLYWPAPRARGGDAASPTPTSCNLTALVIAALTIWYGLRRLPLAYSAYAIATVGYPLLFPARASSR